MGLGMTENRRILIVDDHEIIMGGLKFLLESNLSVDFVESVGTVKEATDKISSVEYDLILLDIMLPDGYGLELRSLIQSSQSDCKVMVLTGETKSAEIFKAISLGIDVVVSKIDEVETILDGVKAAELGQKYVSPSIAAVIESGTPSIILPPRSMEVLLLLNKGFSNKQIAYDLDVALPTVSFHLRELRERLGAKQNREILRKASELGLL